MRHRQVFQLARRGMFIQTQDTPNPNAMMFLPGQDVMGEVRPARDLCRHCRAARVGRGEADRFLTGPQGAYLAK